MAILDGIGLKKLVQLFKNYIGMSWSLSGDTNDTIILINDNLNNYTTIGNYYCRPDSDAKTVSNNPSGISFILKVYSGVGRSYDTSNGNYLTQYLEDYKGNAWVRYKSTGSWSSWNKIFTMSGDSTVGSGTNSIYMDGGVLTASASTVGSGTKPVYLNSGTFTASGSTVGGTAQPAYLNSGTITNLSSTVGSSTQPTYLSSGKITASSSTVGADDTPIYLKSGVLTACTTVADDGISDYQLGSSGYVRYDCGLIIQWGQSSSSGSEVHITYPIKYTNSSSYSIVKNEGSPNGGTSGFGYVSIWDRSASGGTTANSGSNYGQWLSIGY